MQRFFSDGGYASCSRTRSIRSTQRCLPRMASVSNRPKPTAWPVVATRRAWITWPILTSFDATNSFRSRSRVSGSNDAAPARQALNSELDTTIVVIEGVDELCKACPLCKGDRCESPNGNEEQVRRWDAILLKELGLSFGEALKVRDLQSLLKKKAPFRLCYLCKWKESCTIGSQVV